ncbi:N-6 DNA methylase [Microbacterium sp. CFBP 8790]|uniref:HsdM family class I SAM-dependent methyltransferase n=1 Tax=unclassified Microbacterium TaxID=2609290 RepID=UPI00177B76D0|nr:MULTISPECIES: N-6 DNA methylase [unclassified Microbacterium]MBD8207775.1 N-6 DNA methylase [Microbacterium sp. CFBP 8801]MBD8510343.1 N-6 DNA methylase [Microbacterium sp. CFBP 8790]
MGNERSTDQFVRDMLREIGYPRPWEQSCSDAPSYIYEALEGASKSGGSGRGKPEFVVESGEFIVVVEDKARFEDSHLLDDEGRVALDSISRVRYALNGAVHYARTFADKTNKKVFAVGVAGTESHYDMRAAYVAPRLEPKVLGRLETLTPFAAESIDEYHRVAVLGELPREEREVREIRKVAVNLHEGMRNYASLENENKATLVSAILLALKYRPELLDDLTGDQRNGYRDGEKVYNAAKEFLESPEADLGPKQKIGIMLDRFAFIRRHVLLNQRNRDLGKTPLQHFTEILDHEVFEVVSSPSHSAFDVLGNFYGEFVKYGGSDGNSLGIVLTPHHITDLMAELVDVNSDDVVLDPTAGSGAFLIAAMRRMFADAIKRYGDNPARLNERLDEIKRFQLHGVELQDKLFAVGTTNMILRGDGKANFQRRSFFDATRDDFFPYNPERPGRLEGFTKVLMNPPYSQSKDKTTRHLSELSFIERALSHLEVRGRLGAIVPQSAMVGKTREDKALKAKILKHHTLDAVLTMNPDTFHGVGTHVVIALFTAGVPHPATKKTAFVDFKDDGYKVRQHVGLVDDGRAADRRTHVLEVLQDGVPDDTSFVVRSEVAATDEWQHSYFYFNDQPPSYEDFYATVADYLTWQVDMHTHGRGDLIAPAAAEDKAEIAVEEGISE